MSTQIMNGGIRGAILNLVDNTKLSPEDLEEKNYLNSLPKNQWIDLDKNGKMITKEEADKQFEENLSKFKPIQ